MADAKESSFGCIIALYDADFKKIDEKPFNVTLLEIKSVQHTAETSEDKVGESKVVLATIP